MTAKKSNKPWSRNRNVGLGFKPRKDDILRLRKKGKSYNQIAKMLGCSLSTISYHCGTKLKKPQKQGWKVRFAKKINKFKSRCTAEEYRTFRSKIKTFKRKFPKGTRARGSGVPTNSRVNNITKDYYAEDVINKIGTSPVCYLTGRKVDIKDTSSYTFDHRVPTTLGGTNDLENLEICSTEANHAKAGLSLNNFYSLCAEILSWRDKNK